MQLLNVNYHRNAGKTVMYLFFQGSQISIIQHVQLYIVVV
jgi:hypothetical protein